MRKLYKPGTMQVIWGVPCDYKDFPDDEVDQALAEGWETDPLECDPKLLEMAEKGAEIEPRSTIEKKPARKPAKRAAKKPVSK